MFVESLPSGKMDEALYTNLSHLGVAMVKEFDQLDKQRLVSLNSALPVQCNRVGMRLCAYLLKFCRHAPRRRIQRLQPCVYEGICEPCRLRLRPCRIGIRERAAGGGAVSNANPGAQESDPTSGHRSRHPSLH